MAKKDEPKKETNGIVKYLGWVWPLNRTFTVTDTTLGTDSQGALKWGRGTLNFNQKKNFSSINAEEARFIRFINFTGISE